MNPCPYTTEMTTPAPIAPRERPCFRCGYDLRGTAAVDGVRRCPECGTVCRGRVYSRIPWVHRRHLGVVRAYLRTISFVLLRPGEMARESWIGESDARGFHRLSLLVVTVLTTALLLGTFFLRGDLWRHDLAAHIPAADEFSGPISDFPMHALTDGPWIVVPLAISVWLGLAVALWIYRGFLRVLSGNRRHRRRVRSIGFYASAILPGTLTLLGLLAMGGMVLYEDHPWLPESPATVWAVSLIVLGFLAAASFYVPTLWLVWTTGRWRILRTILMLPIFAYAAGLAGLGVATAVFWTTGYLAIALWSMIH
jgi:hypothetical protein